MKKKHEPSGSIREALARARGAVVTVTENGVTSKRSQIDAMVDLLCADFPKASIRDRISILRYLDEGSPDPLLERPATPSNEAIHAFVERLAQEARDLEERSAER